MDWNEKLQQIIDYTEHHLQRTEEPVDTSEIAGLAGCSYSFFQRVFSYMNGISFAEYIRFRKLTLAGYDLKSTNLKVIDLSYKYGYESPTSFTKAFFLFHGVSPTEARNSSVTLRVYPKMQILDQQNYSWEICHHPRLRLIGKSMRLTPKDNLHEKAIPAFWNKCQQNGEISRLISIDTGNPKGLFGLFQKTEYFIMVQSNHDVPLGFQKIILPESAWAVFDCWGAVPMAIQKGWRYLTEEWLITYPFRHAKCPELEWYNDGNSYDENYLSQIWIPNKFSELDKSNSIAD